MTFRPPSGTTSTEKIEDVSIRGFTFSDVTKQHVQGGTIRMLPQLTGDYQRQGAKWPELNWDVQEEFPNLPEDVKQRWGYLAPVGVTLDFSSYSRYLRFNLTGEINFLFQTQGGEAGKTRFGDNADNAVGYVLETRVEVFSSPTGDARDGASLLFDDGAIRDEIKFSQDRIYLKSDPEVGISGVFTSPKDFRVMVRGSDLWMWVEGQEGLNQTGALSQASTTKSLQLGSPTGGVTADVRFDYLYQRYLWTADTPVDLATGFGFDTSMQSTQLPIHAPAKSVQAWVKAIIETVHGESNLEITDPYVMSEDFDGLVDNSDLLTTQPLVWTGVAAQNYLSGNVSGMNIDFDGGNGLAHSAGQSVRFIGSGGQLKADHYVQYTLGPSRVSDGSFVADAAGRNNPYIFLKDDAVSQYYYSINWAEYLGNILFYITKIDRFASSVHSQVAFESEVATSANTPTDGAFIRAEIRGRILTFLIDYRDGNGWTKVAEGEDIDEATWPAEDGEPGFWLGVNNPPPNQSCMDSLEIGNLEGESNTTIGTTRLRVEYSSDRGATYALAKIVSIAEVPATNVDLSDVPVVGSGMDALKLTVEQISPGQLAEPIRVRQVTVKATYDVSGVELYPDWGPKIGGTSVAATLQEEAKQNFGSVPSLATLTAYGSAGAATSLTGDYGVITSFPGRGQAYGTPSLVGSPTLVLDAIAVGGEGTYETLLAQGVYANSGEGLLYSDSTDTGRQLLRGYLSVQEGSVRVEVDSDIHLFRKGSYVDLRALGLLWESAGAYNLRILGDQAGSIWKHRLESTAPWTYAPAEAAASSLGHLGIQGWVYAEGFHTGEQPVFSSLDGTGTTSGMEVGFDANGYPYVKVRDALGAVDSVTGEFPVVVGEITHLMGALAEYDDGVALQVLTNGETCGQKRTNLQASQVGNGRPREIAARPGTTGIDPRSAVRCAQERISQNSPDPRRAVAEQGIANPVFELDRNWPVRTSTRLLLDLDRKEGAVYDRSGYGNWPIVPEDYRRRTQRGADGYWGRSTFFVSREGGMRIPWSEGLNPDTGFTVSLFAKVYSDPDDLSTVWSQTNDAGDGWEVDIDLEGRASFVVYDGVSSYIHTHTGALLGINAWRPAMFKYDPDAGSVRSRIGESDWEESTGFPVIADLTGASHWLGRGTFGLLDNVAFHRELLSDTFWATLTGESVKYTPSEPVTFRGVTVSDVRHWDINQKFFTSPTGALGDADVNISAYGVEWPAVKPFFYTDAYNISVDETTIVGQVCGTKSPFRIGNTVPDGGVNLALINSPSMSVPGNVGFTDLSAEEIANIAFYNQGDFVIQDPSVTGENSGEFYYPPSIDTEEIRVSHRSVMRKNFKQPKPLFYMHLLGRGRYYVYNPDATTSTDADLIRQNIHIETYEGARVDLDDFGWDVEVQVVDYYNTLLPSHYFSVILYCERVPHGQTYFVVYDAADARQGWLRDLSRREAINPVPIFSKISSDDTIDDFEYSMDLDTGGSYSLRIDRS